MDRTPYHSDVTDSEWKILEMLMPMNAKKRQAEKIRMAGNNERNFLRRPFRVSVATNAS
jgi:transposase